MSDERLIDCSFADALPVVHIQQNVEEIHLVYGTDDNYILPTMISAASAARCFVPRGRKLIIHLFDAGVTDVHYEHFVKTVCRENPVVDVCRHNLNAELFDGMAAWRGSYVTYSRMFMADILKEVEWAIYCDGDTLWTGDVGALWNLRDKRYVIQASVEPIKTSDVVGKEVLWYASHKLAFDRKNYCCMGLMLMNLELARREQVARKCRGFIRRFPAHRTADQTVLNYVCLGRINPLPLQWGVLSFCHRGVDLAQDALIHYANDLPWRRDSIGKLNSDVVRVWIRFAKSIGEYAEVEEGGGDGGCLSFSNIINGYCIYRKPFQHMIRYEIPAG